MLDLIVFALAVAATKFITKQPKRNNIIYLCKKVAALISLLILLWAGLHWLTWFHATFIVAYMSKGNINQLRRVQDQVEESSRQKFQQKQQQTIIKPLSTINFNSTLHTIAKRSSCQRYRIKVQYNNI